LGEGVGRGRRGKRERFESLRGAKGGERETAAATSYEGTPYSDKKNTGYPGEARP